MQRVRVMCLFKLAFYDADTDTDILADILARMSVSVLVSVSMPWNSSFTPQLLPITGCTAW